MNDNTVIKKSFFNQLNSALRSNIRSIIIVLSLFFAIFLIFQIYSVYSSNKINNNSIVFFNNQNLEDQNSISKTIQELSNQSGFYGILSKLELIEKHIKNKNYGSVESIYDELLTNKKLNKIYKSAIATKASYEFIDINFSNLSKDYNKTIKNFISSIDDELINYEGVKLELSFLAAILNIEKNNLNYLNDNEAIDLYDNIMSSDVASSSIKERVNKIHEYYTYK